MSEGTSLDDIESGSIENIADNDVMSAILSDMNAVDPDPIPAYQAPPLQPPVLQHTQHQFQAPPMPPPFQEEDSTYFEDHYQPIPDPVRTVVAGTKPNVAYDTVAPKKNSWSSLLDMLRDPLFVGILVFLFALPELHTRLGKYAGWAYKVGGALSWTGLAVQSLLAAILFAGYQYMMSHTSALDFVKSL